MSFLDARPWLWRILQLIALCLVLGGVAYLTYLNSPEPIPVHRSPVPPPPSPPSPRPSRAAVVAATAIGYPFIPHTVSSQQPRHLDVLWIDRFSYNDPTTGLRQGTENARFSHPSELLASLPADFAAKYPLLVFDNVEFENATVGPDVEFDTRIGTFLQVSNLRFMAYVAKRADHGKNRHAYTVFAVNRELATSRVNVKYDDGVRVSIDLVDFNVSLAIPLCRVSVLPRSRSNPDGAGQASPRPAYRNMLDQLLALMTDDNRPAHGTLLLATSRSNHAERKLFVDQFLRDHLDSPLGLYTNTAGAVDATDRVLAILALDKLRTRYRSTRPKLLIRESVGESRRLLDTPLSAYRADAIRLELMMLFE